MYNVDDGYQYLNDNTIRSSEIFTIVIGSISIVFPLSVVVILLYKWNLLLKDRPLTLLILQIAISDTMASFATLLGFPQHQLCYAQGFIIFFFAR